MLTAVDDNFSKNVFVSFFMRDRKIFACLQAVCVFKEELHVKCFVPHYCFACKN